ncbi:MAG: hypothetical protein HQM06_12470 [Magnetococcales bacterium]|nr:hypothetical protein [Magnetococcales bacterium]
MSRSRRKNSICGSSTAASEKADKQSGNRRNRRINKIRLAQEQEPLHRDVICDVWKMDKDGKIWFDRKKWPKLMRK